MATFSVEAAREILTIAEQAYMDARDIYEKAVNGERDYKLERDAGIVLNMRDADFLASDPHGSPDRPYVLPFGKDTAKWNPFDVENATFGKEWLAGMTSIICKRTDAPRTRPTRLIFTSSTIPAEHDKIGSQFHARHNHTGASLGNYEVVGLVIYSPTGNVLRAVGDTPNIAFACSTYK